MAVRELLVFCAAELLPELPVDARQFAEPLPGRASPSLAPSAGQSERVAVSEHAECRQNDTEITPDRPAGYILQIGLKPIG